MSSLRGCLRLWRIKVWKDDLKNFQLHFQLFWCITGLLDGRAIAKISIVALKLQFSRFLCDISQSLNPTSLWVVEWCWLGSVGGGVRVCWTDESRWPYNECTAGPQTEILYLFVDTQFGDIVLETARATLWRWCNTASCVALLLWQCWSFKYQGIRAFSYLFLCGISRGHVSFSFKLAFSKRRQIDSSSKVLS